MVLRVFTGSWGDSHDPREVRLLRDQVADNLTLDHQFVCVSDHLITGIPCINHGTLPGWWRKLEILQCRGPAMWLDLDVVITGSLDDLVHTYMGEKLAAPWNWAQSGHGGVQSSVMLWWGSLAEVIENFDPKDAQWPPRNTERWDSGHPKWGDQEFLSHLRDTGQLDVTQINPAWVKSFKYHCRESVPDDCRVVVFHGKPKPAQVSDDWVKSCRY